MLLYVFVCMYLTTALLNPFKFHCNLLWLLLKFFKLQGKYTLIVTLEGQSYLVAVHLAWLDGIGAYFN